MGDIGLAAMVAAAADAVVAVVLVLSSWETLAWRQWSMLLLMQ